MRVLACVSLVALAVMLCPAPSAAAEGTPEAPQPSMSAWRLIAAPGAELHDPADVARLSLDLSDDQQAKLRTLAGQQEEERAALLRDLHEKHAEQVRALLTQEQTGRYDAVLAALDGLASRIAAARAELAEALGDGGEVTLPPFGEPLGDPIQYVPISEETREAYLKALTEHRLALAAALTEKPDLALLSDPERWQAYREKVRAEAERLQAALDARVGQILSQEEVARLRAVEGGIERYESAVQDAWKEAYLALAGTLGVAAEAEPTQ